MEIVKTARWDADEETLAEQENRRGIIRATAAFSALCVIFAGVFLCYQVSTARIEGAPVLPSMTLSFRTTSIFRLEKFFPIWRRSSCR